MFRRIRETPAQSGMLTHRTAPGLRSGAGSMDKRSVKSSGKKSPTKDKYPVVLRKQSTHALKRPKMRPLQWNAWLSEPGKKGAGREVEDVIQGLLVTNVYPLSDKEKLDTFLSKEGMAQLKNVILDQLKVSAEVPSQKERRELIRKLVEKRFADEELDPLVTNEDLRRMGVHLLELSVLERDVLLEVFDSGFESESVASEYLPPDAIVESFAIAREICSAYKMKASPDEILSLAFNRERVEAYCILSSEEFIDQLKSDIPVLDTVLTLSKAMGFISEEGVPCGDAPFFKIAIRAAPKLMELTGLSATQIVDLIKIIEPILRKYSLDDPKRFEFILYFILDGDRFDYLMAYREAELEDYRALAIPIGTDEFLDRRLFEQLEQCVESLARLQFPGSKLYLPDTETALDRLELLGFFTLLCDRVKANKPDDPSAFLRWLVIDKKLELLKPNISDYKEFLDQVGVGARVLDPLKFRPLPDVPEDVIEKMIDLARSRLVISKRRHPPSFKPSAKELSEAHASLVSLADYFSSAIRTIENRNRLQIGRLAALEETVGPERRSDEGLGGLQDLLHFTVRLL